MKRKNAYRPARQFVQKLLKNSEIRILFEEERAKTEIAMVVREARLRAGLTQNELAKKAETTQAVISRIESGTDTRIPSLALLARIAAACKAKLMFGFDFKKDAVA
jgi:ribosome-binding protein aMBF1 (putative translation factor)